MAGEKLNLCDVPTALEEIHAGRVLAIVDDDVYVREGALVMASETPSPGLLRFMISATSSLACMAVPDADFRHLKIPSCLENEYILGAIFPEIKKRTSGECSSDAFERHIIPFTARKSGVLRYPRPAECITDLSRLLGEKRHCFFSSFKADAVMEKVDLFAQEHAIKILSIAELVRYRLVHERHVRSKSTFLVRSRFGEFKFRCIESDVFDRCAVLIKGEEQEFDHQPPLARIERVPTVGGMCACLAICMEAAFQDTVELMYRDGHGIIVFIPAMRDFSPEEMAQKSTLEFFKDDPFSTLEDSTFQKVRSAGMCAQILQHLGANRIRIVSNRPRRVRAIESFGIEIIEEVHVGPGSVMTCGCAQ